MIFQKLKHYVIPSLRNLFSIFFCYVFFLYVTIPAQVKGFNKVNSKTQQNFHICLYSIPAKDKYHHSLYGGGEGGKSAHYYSTIKLFTSLPLSMENVTIT